MNWSSNGAFSPYEQVLLRIERYFFKTEHNGRRADNRAFLGAIHSAVRSGNYLVQLV